MRNLIWAIAVNRHGKNVNHLIYTDQNDQLTKLIEVINDLLSLNISRKDIVILSPRKRQDSVVNLLDGIKVKDYSVQNFADIRFSTIQGFKGLESLYVILTDIESYKDERLVYVGLSRARFSLTVLETQEASDERDKLFFERRVKNTESTARGLLGGSDEPERIHRPVYG